MAAQTAMNPYGTMGSAASAASAAYMPSFGMRPMGAATAVVLVKYVQLG
jgi:hypothetical protein